MSNRYAQIVQNRVVSVSTLSGSVEAPDMIPLEPGADVRPGAIWDGATFANPEPVEPEPSPRQALDAVQMAAARRDLPDLLGSMSAAEKTAAAGLVPAWSGDAVALDVGALVRHDGAVYRVVQAHTTQTGWTPPAVPALFEPV